MDKIVYFLQNQRDKTIYEVAQMSVDGKSWFVSGFVHCDFLADAGLAEYDKETRQYPKLIAVDMSNTICRVDKE